MSFLRAVVEIKPASVGTGIKASLKKTSKSSARLTLTLNVATAKALAWDDGDGIDVLIGEGEHHGLLRLRKNRSAAVVTLEKRTALKGDWFSLRLGHQAAFVDRSEATQWCQWEKVEDGWVELVLPKWADETGRKSQPGKAANRGATVLPAQRGMDVTGALMGDPPPGRREMLDKIGKVKG